MTDILETLRALAAIGHEDITRALASGDPVATQYRRDHGLDVCRYWDDCTWCCPCTSYHPAKKWQWWSDNETKP